VNSPYPDHTREYFPLIVESSITYQVDSVVFDDAPDGNKLDTVRFQLKEEVASQNVTVSGDTVYYLHRYRRENEFDSWRLTDVWTAEKTNTEAQKTEENLTFLKMSFPLKYGKRWYATSYINPSTLILVGTEQLEAYQEWEAEVLSFDQSGQIGSFQFPTGQVMTIDQTNTDDGASKRYVHETYVRNIGLVARIDTILDSRCLALGDFGPCLGKPWIEHAGKGYILSQVMIDYQ
ncbi:MAG TPA: hypothetical protein VJ508_18950, partial [Saprospiraceae bacterium]|nr:hypothetical protein [Saprospiraceae bacterium]